jgi:hypothetical protein
VLGSERSLTPPTVDTSRDRLVGPVAHFHFISIRRGSLRGISRFCEVSRAVVEFREKPRKTLIQKLVAPMGFESVFPSRPRFRQFDPVVARPTEPSQAQATKTRRLKFPDDAERTDQIGRQKILQRPPHAPGRPAGRLRHDQRPTGDLTDHRHPCSRVVARRSERVGLSGRAPHRCRS